MMKTLFVFVCLFVAIAYGGCIQPRGYNPNLCRFNPYEAFVNDTDTFISSQCIRANADVFSGDFAINTQKDSCNAALVTDGDDCVRAYAKYKCSSLCALCGQKACKSLCEDLNDACPTAVGQECFSEYSCAVSDDFCTNYGVRLETDQDEEPPSTAPTTSAGSSFAEMSLMAAGMLAVVFIQ